MQRLGLEEPHVGPLTLPMQDIPFPHEPTPMAPFPHSLLYPSRGTLLTYLIWILDTTGVPALEAPPGWPHPTPTPLHAAFVAADVVTGMIKTLVLGLRELEMSAEGTVHSRER